MKSQYFCKDTNLSKFGYSLRKYEIFLMVSHKQKY